MESYLSIDGVAFKLPAAASSQDAVAFKLPAAASSQDGVAFKLPGGGIEPGWSRLQASGGGIEPGWSRLQGSAVASVHWSELIPSLSMTVAAPFDPTMLESIRFHVLSNATSDVQVPSLCVGDLTVLMD